MTKTTEQARTIVCDGAVHRVGTWRASAGTGETLEPLAVRNIREEPDAFPSGRAPRRTHDHGRSQLPQGCYGNVVVF